MKACPEVNPKPERLRDKLLEALQESDNLRRSSRADRLEWLSLRDVRFPALIGRAETLQLLDEARNTFVDGHFVAALLLAMAYVEHAIIEELRLVGLTAVSLKFSRAIDLAAEKKLFPSDWLQRARALSLLRNPFAHLKKSGDRFTLGSRVVNERRHPRAVMEADARDALELMFDFLAATTRELDPEWAVHE